MESYVKDFQSFQASKDERPVTLVCFSKKSIKIGNHRCSKCKKKKKKKKFGGANYNASTKNGKLGVSLQKSLPYKKVPLKFRVV